MNAEETRFALLDRLHDEGVLPEECDSVIGSTRAKTRKQRADGTWAWEVTWGEPGGERTRSAGSSSTMGECLAAENWSVTEAEDGRITIVPVLPALPCQVDLTGHSMGLRYVEVLTDAGVVRVSAGQVNVRSGRPVVEVNVERNLEGCGIKATEPGGDWDVRVNNGLTSRTGITLIRKSLLLNTSFIANVDGMRRHKWNYGGADPYTAKRRVCEHCPVQQRTFGVGTGRHWDWRLGDDEPWRFGKAPGCPEPPEPETEWSRVEDKHPRWEIRNPHGDGKSYLCTDEVIRVFGRQHVEHLLRDLPPLPGKAWEVLDG